MQLCTVEVCRDAQLGSLGYEAVWQQHLYTLTHFHSLSYTFTPTNHTQV